MRLVMNIDDLPWKSQIEVPLAYVHWRDWNNFSFLFQEQYQFLYKAMLSLVSTKENGNGPMTLDKNGAVMASDESDPAESMESLV